jgi:hypothetical protein
MRQPARVAAATEERINITPGDGPGLSSGRQCGEKSGSFFKKRRRPPGGNQKLLILGTRAGRTGTVKVQKFFASFFQKRSPSYRKLV